MDGLQRSEPVALGVLIFGLLLLVGLALVTIVGGVAAAWHHPGDVSLETAYAALIYTSPYVIYGALGAAFYKLKKSRSISFTHLIGVGAMIATWVYRNVIQANEDVSFAYSLYDSLFRCFVQTAIIGVVFVAVMLMEAFLMVTPPYEEDDEFEDR